MFPKRSDCCVAVLRQVTPAEPSYNPGGRMAKAPRTLLLTRPEDASRRFAAAVEGALGGGWRVVVSPLMETRFLTVPVPDCDTLVFTSETAVRAVARLGTDRRALAWCVGPRTEEAACAAGFSTKRGGGTAEELVAAILADRPASTVFCPRAQDQAVDVAKLLNLAGIETVSEVVYAQIAHPPTVEARDLMAGADPVMLPLFSARSARLARAAFLGHRAPLCVAAISAQVAQEADGLDARQVALAETPDAAGMIGALAVLAAKCESG